MRCRTEKKAKRGLITLKPLLDKLNIAKGGNNTFTLVRQMREHSNIKEVWRKHCMRLLNV